MDILIQRNEHDSDMFDLMEPISFGVQRVFAVVHSDIIANLRRKHPAAWLDLQDGKAVEFTLQPKE